MKVHTLNFAYDLRYIANPPFSWLAGVLCQQGSARLQRFPTQEEEEEEMKRFLEAALSLSSCYRGEGEETNTQDE